MAKEKEAVKEVEEKEERAEAKVGALALGVYNARGSFVREYNAELHGSRMKECAESYAKKIGGEVRKLR